MGQVLTIWKSIKKFSPPKLLDAGYSFIEIMVVAGIVSIALLALANVNMRMLTGNSGTPELAQMDTFRRSVTGLVQDNKAWANTVAADQNISTCFNPPPQVVCTTTPGQSPDQSSCINNCFGSLGPWWWWIRLYIPSYANCYNNCMSQSSPPITTCTPPTIPVCPAQFVGPGQARQFAIYDDSNAKIYDSSKPQQGIDRTGKPCMGFDSVNPTPSCPFRYDIRWYALTATQNPQVAVTAALQVSPNTQKGTNLNANMFAITIPIIREAK
jgi:hypothetical protein